MKKLVLLRHGEIEGSGNRYTGVTNARLSERGRGKIVSLAEGLQKERFDGVICSPLDRCRDTLQLLGRSEHAIIDERIREIDFGLWENKTFSFIKKQYPQEVVEWSGGGPKFRFPDGESVGEFQTRVADFARSLSTMAGERILIVTHGGVIRHLICFLLNLPMVNYLYFQIDYGRLVFIDLHSEGGILTGLNRRCIDG